MKRVLVLVIAVIVVLALANAADANASPTCIAVYDSGVQLTVCDSDVYPDGTFLRCVDVRNDVEYAWECRAMVMPSMKV